MTHGAVSFTPPHCPRADCPFHTCTVGWRWIRWGGYSRRAEPNTIPRFRCVHCGITFSSQTFSTTYYLKRPELLEPLFHRLLAGSGLRQITREARCAHSTLMGQAARLGRHALLHLHAQRPAGPVREPLVIDGFESFALSQYHPLHLHLVVGAESHYVYGFTLSGLRRKGRMTARQRAMRARLEARDGRPDPQALIRDMAVALRVAVPEPQALTVRSDEHPAYPIAFRRLPGYRIRHECTPSVVARTPGNPLFPVNLIDLLLRHNSANHKRETIAFSKCYQAVVERAAVLILWRNFAKRFSENHGGSTPAMRLGLKATPLSPRALLEHRWFAEKVSPPDIWADYYRRRVVTWGKPAPRELALKRAF
jgi:transposase-like protein